MKNQFTLPLVSLSLASLAFMAPSASAKDIVHDADYYVLEAQHGKQWAKDDKAVDKKLAEFRKTNGSALINHTWLR